MREKRNIAKDLFYQAMSTHYKEIFGYSPSKEKQEDWDRIIDTMIDAAKHEILIELGKIEDDED